MIRVLDVVPGEPPARESDAGARRDRRVPVRGPETRVWLVARWGGLR